MDSKGHFEKQPNLYRRIQIKTQSFTTFYEPKLSINQLYRHITKQNNS